MRIICKKGYKTITDFYADIANEFLDPNDIIKQFLELQKKEQDQEEHTPQSVENYIVSDATAAESLAKKIAETKGVKSVQRNFSKA